LPFPIQDELGSLMLFRGTKLTLKPFRVGQFSLIEVLEQFIIPAVLFYFSIDKVPSVQSPVLVIHGTEDEVIDFSHGLAIYDKCPRAVEPLWVEVS
jgi:pimeloyl-ACP methyl ester carboxylesterase